MKPCSAQSVGQIVVGALHIHGGAVGQSWVALLHFRPEGQLVSSLVKGEEQAGYHEVKFDGTGLASGVYFYRLQVGSFVKAMKMLILH